MKSALFNVKIMPCTNTNNKINIYLTLNKVNKTNLTISGSTYSTLMAKNIKHITIINTII